MPVRAVDSVPAECGLLRCAAKATLLQCWDLRCNIPVKRSSPKLLGKLVLVIIDSIHCNLFCCTGKPTMPLLQREPDLFPDDLLDNPESVQSEWWALYTLSRQEKKLMRLLRTQQLPFYAPVIARRFRSPSGRPRTSFEPLFPNYVFLCGDNEARYRAVCTGCVSRYVAVPNPEELVTDLRQIRDLIATDAPLAPERRLEPGQRVRIRNGPFAGYEGIIVRREKETRLVVYVRFMAQGVSVAINDCQVEAL